LRRTLFIAVIIILIPIALKLVGDAMGLNDFDNSTFKTLLVPVASIFLDTFNSPTIAIVLSLLIIAVSLVLSALLLGKARRIAYVLNAATTNLDHPAAGTSDGFMRAVDVNDELGRIARAGLHWSGGANAPRADELEAQMRLERIDRRGISLAMYRDLPDFFVGIGLVLTFCGLVAGLYFASRGLLNADLTVAKDSLTRLLQASTFKFMTSIAGVSGSLLLSFAWRLAANRIEQARASLAIAMAEKLRGMPAGVAG
jgi:hypothetical protein